LSELSWRQAYLRLHQYVGLKRLERLYLYHILQDELYELSDSAEPFLLRCDGSTKGGELTSEVEFVEYCINEGLIEILGRPDPISVVIGKALQPSLRYLELQLTHACNLKCRHCYLGPPRSDALSLDEALKITNEFASYGGLRLLISGGEPLLYPDLKDFIDKTADLKVRRVLFTNGTLINAKNIEWLKVEEIQFSLDGWREGHDLMRGKGSFDRTIESIRTVQKAGISISIATMIHRGNLTEFEKIRRFCDEIGAVEWGIDVLALAGSLKENRDLVIPYNTAVPFMTYAYGGGYHGASEGYACGRHLLTVLPTGRAVKCGFYNENHLGDARLGLMDCWVRLKHIPLEKLKCKNCVFIEDCAGGCRFRASHPLGPDPVMCTLYGVQMNSVSGSN
jgi:radical SAM protein with 4Fe4S-binding SPASM domain